MGNWKPEEFATGDRVINQSQPDWGVGVVTHVVRMSDMELWDSRVVTIQKKSVGQRLSIRFEDGRTRTIVSSKTPLKRAE